VPDQSDESGPEEPISEEMEKFLAVLDERERNIVIFRFGLIDGKIPSLEEAGEKFNMTRERVRQIEALAMDKLRRAGGTFDFPFE